MMHLVTFGAWAQRLGLRARGFRPRVVHSAVGPVHLLEHRAGQGPTLVVIHGIGADLTHFSRVLTALRALGGVVIAPDLPGHGASPPPSGGAGGLRTGALEALAEVIQEPAIVFGNSLGGLVAIRFALAYPEKVRGLILSSPGGAPMEEAALRGLLSQFRMDAPEKARAFVLRLYAKRHWFTPLAAPFVRASFARPFMERILDEATVEELVTAEEIASIAAPLLFLWGGQDKVLLPENRDFFLRALPSHAVVKEPPHFGHCPNVEHPRELIAEIASFTRAVVEGRAPAGHRSVDRPRP